MSLRGANVVVGIAAVASLLSQQRLFATPPTKAPLSVQASDLHGDALPTRAVARLGTVRFHVPGRFLALCFSADGTSVLLAGVTDAEYVLRLMDVAGGKVLSQFAVPATSAFVPQLALAPDGKVAATCPDGRAVKFFDVKSGKLLRTFGGEQRVHSFAFSPDNKLLAVGSFQDAADNSVKVWDTVTDRQVAQFQGHTMRVHCVAFAPAGRRLASGSADHSILIWKTPALEAPATEPNEQELQGLWEKLAGDARSAHQASAQLIGCPNVAVKLLARKLPLALPDGRKLAELIGELDHDDYPRRRQASLALAKMGPIVEPALRKALAATSSVEVRGRILDLLILFQDRSPQHVQASRALAVLERIGGPEARRVVASVGDEIPEARASLKRMSK